MFVSWFDCPPPLSEKNQARPFVRPIGYVMYHSYSDTCGDARNTSPTFKTNVSEKLADGCVFGSFKCLLAIILGNIFLPNVSLQSKNSGGKTLIIDIRYIRCSSKLSPNLRLCGSGDDHSNTDLRMPENTTKDKSGTNGSHTQVHLRFTRLVRTPFVICFYLEGAAALTILLHIFFLQKIALFDPCCLVLPGLWFLRGHWLNMLESMLWCFLGSGSCKDSQNLGHTNWPRITCICCNRNVGTTWPRLKPIFVIPTHDISWFLQLKLFWF